MAKTIGGGNYTQLYKLTSGWDPSTEILGTDDHLKNQFSTAIAGHEKTKNLQATLTHERFDEAFTKMLDDYLWTEEPESELYENGVEAGSVVGDPTASETPVGLAIIYSGKESGGKRFVRAFPFRLQGGGYTMEANASIRPETVLVNVQVPTTESITIGTTYFDSTLVTATTAVVIGGGEFGTSVWIATPTT